MYEKVAGGASRRESLSTDASGSWGALTNMLNTPKKIGGLSNFFRRGTITQENK